MLKKIGIFLDEIKDSTLSRSEKFSKLGFNTGNMMFWQSLKSNLDLDVKSRWYIKHSEQLNVSEYQAFVTTDLIWIKQMQDYSYVNEILDVIGDLPLVPLSIGFQSNVQADDFKVHPETIKVIQRIAERCIMGVRGNYSAEILKKYGINNFSVIGCPSMYMNAPCIRKVQNTPKNINLVNANFETFFDRLGKEKVEFLKYCCRNGFGFVEQTQSEPTLQQIPDKNDFEVIKAYIESNSNCFMNINDWRKYIRQFDFSIGARFHGNVVGIWEGVPALFLTCDSRTRELCEFFSLPCMPIELFDSNKPIEFYYEKSDYSGFHKNYEEKYNAWMDLLEHNSLIKKSDASDSVRKGRKVNKNLYTFWSANNILTQMVHAYNYNSSGENYILFNNWMKGLYPQYNMLMTEGSFKNVIFFDPNKIKYECDYNESINNIIAFFDEAFNQLGEKAENFDNVFLTVFDVALQIYLQIKKVRYNIFAETQNQGIYEFGRGRATASKNVGKLNIDKYFHNFNLLDIENDFIKRYYFNMEEYTDISHPKYENFNLDNELKHISEKNAEFMIKFFNVPNIDAEKYSAMLLTQWYTLPNGQKWVSNDIVQMYGKFLDYYYDSSYILIKPHPADTSKNDYDKYLDNVSTINVIFPAELMVLNMTGKFKSVMTVSSTAITLIQKYSESKIQLGNQFVEIWRSLETYYVCSEFVNVFCDNFDKIRFYGGNLNTTASFISQFINDPKYGDITWCYIDKLEENSVNIIDNISMNGPGRDATLYRSIMENRAKNMTFIFTNKIDPFWLFNSEIKKLINDIIPIKIEKEAMSADCCFDLEPEYIFIFTTNNELKSKIKNFDMTRHLVHSRVKFTAKLTDMLSAKIDYIEYRLNKER